ncbi:unnamed protein product, partial [Pylaiella littoralis]
SNKTTPHVHKTYDMIPTLFAVLSANSTQDCGPKTSDGIPIPATFSIGTQVLQEVLICDGEEYVHLTPDE